MAIVAGQIRGRSGQTRTKFEYAEFFGAQEVLYLGEAHQLADPADPVWTIKRFDYMEDGQVNRVSDIQTYEGVAWDDRATLIWV
jgi:hypothetical protein